MRKIVKKRLEHGDRVLFRDHIYMAVEIDHDECTADCCLWNPETGMCDGLCYRWDDRPPMVFKYDKPESLCKSSDKVIITGNAEAMAKKLSIMGKKVADL